MSAHDSSEVIALRTGFDADARGKRIYDMRPLVPDDIQLNEDVICVIRNGDGPTVLLCGGIHGDEYEPQVVLRQLVEELAVEDVRGRLIIIPTINPPASQRGARTSPVDGENMNRSFPGRSDGSGTGRLAAFLHDNIFPLSDLLVDVHSGGGDYSVVPMIFGFTDPKCRIGIAELDNIMDGWGYPIVQYVDAIHSTSAGSAPLAGLASVEIEGGGGGAATTQELAVVRNGILRGLHAFGILTSGPAETGSAPVRVHVTSENDHCAPRDGVLEHRVELLTKVKANDLLALLHPSSGRGSNALEIRAKGPGIVLRQRARAFVRAGELICNTGTVRQIE